jgi:muramidase (phage lysozyme)
MNPNRKAFLDTIAWSDDGYAVLVGGTLFDGYADHPRKVIQCNPKLKSTAAGRYQILARYYDAYKRQLGLPDFSPESQDRIAIQLIIECKALGDVDNGYFETAVRKCRSRWASLPGAGYGQHENDLDSLRAVYVTAGGWLA